VLHADKADELRHPASLTKIMTLYLLFERLDAGKIRLDSQLQCRNTPPYSSHQARLKPGSRSKSRMRFAECDKVRDDAAVTVAEAIGGSEGEFADMMTIKATRSAWAARPTATPSGLPTTIRSRPPATRRCFGRHTGSAFRAITNTFRQPSFTYHARRLRTTINCLGQSKE